MIQGGHAKKNWRIQPELIPAEEIKYTHETDVLVVGLSHAGSAALRAAAESGAKVSKPGRSKNTGSSAWTTAT